jgi:hypothetical protein
MSNFSLEAASSQTVDNVELNAIFLDGYLENDYEKPGSIDISEDYPEIKNKSFAHFILIYYRMDNSDTGSHGLDLSTSMQIHKSDSEEEEEDPRSWYQIFYTITKDDDEDTLHYYSANLIVPIIKDADGKSYVNFRIGALGGGKYFYTLSIRGGIG